MNGFTFDGKHSSEFALIVNKKDVPLTPPIENRLQIISGFDGAWDYGVSFQPREISVDCTILAKDKDDLKVKLRNLAGLLNPRKGARPLIFDDDKNVQYFARLANQIPIEQLGSFGTFTLQFVCPDPFTYSVNKKTGTFANTIMANHEGTWVAKPVLTVTHNGGQGKITNTRPDGIIETIEFTEDSPEGVYVIDCKEYTITVDGEPAYDYVTGDFFNLLSGSNQLKNEGNVSKTTIEYYNTWL